MTKRGEAGGNSDAANATMMGVTGAFETLVKPCRPFWQAIS
jgi:hypothetical protein